MKEIIHSDNAPAAIGPYSQAVQVDCGQLVFVSGQIPLDPRTMEIVGGTAAEQTKQVMDNMGAVLEAAGIGYGQIVKTTIYLLDIGDFGEVNEVYGHYFPNDSPARATIEIDRLPMGVKVEIDCIAVKK